MFPRKRRISRSFLSLLRQKRKKTFSTGLFLVTVFESSTVPAASFSVSKKTEKEAVMRNKMRRWGYEAAKGALFLHPVLFVYKKKPKDFGEVKMGVEEFFKRGV